MATRRLFAPINVTFWQSATSFVSFGNFLTNEHKAVRVKVMMRETNPNNLKLKSIWHWRNLSDWPSHWSYTTANNPLWRASVPHGARTMHIHLPKQNESWKLCFLERRQFPNNAKKILATLENFIWNSVHPINNMFTTAKCFPTVS